VIYCRIVTIAHRPRETQVFDARIEYISQKSRALGADVDASANAALVALAKGASTQGIFHPNNQWLMFAA
jgi:hypothetical protein